MIAKVAVLGTFRFPPERIPEVLVPLKALVDATHENDGCIAYDVAEDLYDKGLIRMSELWPDHESLEKHLRAPHIEPWRQAVGELGLISREFMVYDVSNGKPL
ncbi:MAG: putative oxidoreductase [Fibrobacteria bacterium]|jgi:quinol monooxygenase YgiN|nr:putative oxidoreductase [Fibrobacteria bacterium]